MAAWVKAMAVAPDIPKSSAACPLPTLKDTPVTSELTLLLASLVVTLIAEPAHA
jgi:hypothetical protein